MSGAVIWFTGLPACGKTTLAWRVAEQLRAMGTVCCVLDSDEVRNELTPQLGYSVAERNTFYDMLARMAALLARQGQVVLVAATAHRRRYRQWAREVAPRYYEVFVDVPVAECQARDPKGLYAQAAAGRSMLPGVGAGYERPEAPDVVAAGGHDDVVAAVIALLQSPSRQAGAAGHTSDQMQSTHSG